MERRLAAILAADAVGYSRLIREDEASTLTALKAHREELIEPKLAQYHGRIVKLMGDGLLTEFPSAVEAVQCAVEIQHLVGERNADVPEDKRIIYRIGINIGDIVVEDDDIYGDGVNVAARLEGLADPGGICVSRTVFNHIKDKLDLTFEHLGEKEVKNIAEPVTVYRVALDEKAAALVTPVTVPPAAIGRRHWPQIAAALAVLFIGAGSVLWWRPWAPDFEPASVERMAFPLPDKPSIAVLPFTNMSDDPKQEYFADGMTDDLITDLSKVSGLFVIARNSVFNYKGKPVKIGQVAEELGVRYVLEGSVRRAGDQVRVNAQLIDATTGGHLWADRYDGSIIDIFAVQDEFVRKIVKALAANLSEGEQEEIARGQTSNIEAREAFEIGWEHYLRFTPDDIAKAVPYFEKAIELDPDYGRAYAARGLVYFRGCQWRWHRSLGIGYVEAFHIASANLEKAKENPTSLANVLASQIYLYDQRHEEAFAEAERAIALDPNDPEAHIAMAWALITTGSPEDGAASAKMAMRLNPRYPSHYLLALGMAHFATGRLDEAAGAFQQALDRNPDDHVPAAPLAAAYAHLGREQEALQALEIWMTAQGKGGLHTSLGSDWLYNWPYGETEVMERMRDGLRKAEVRDYALGQIGSEEAAIPRLVDALKKGNFLVRWDAVKTLAMFAALGMAEAALPDLTAAVPLGPIA
jgi:TolB-like protein/class 3 adenylate cyclase/Flp pilus assembly protein TadD